MSVDIQTIGVGMATDGLEKGQQALKATEAAANKAADAADHLAQAAKKNFDDVGVSAKQMAANLRMVGPQMTDIVTGLMSGQAPFTVLIQQGGQLKDVFGGIGPAAKAVGSYVAGLINPFTVAAAAAAGVAAAMYKGSQEAGNYTRALIMSGDAAGVTASQMSVMAQRIAGISGTQAAASAALAEMAGSTKIAGANLEYFSSVAGQMERVIGQPVAATRKEFESLAKSPAEAVLKLNDTYGFLTGSVYKQIRALEDQGKALAAGELAQTTYAQAMEQRATQVAASLGTLEKAWKTVMNAAKGAWDAMLNVGREASGADKLKEIDDKIAKMTAARAAGGASQFLPGRAQAGSASELAALQAQRDTLAESLRLQDSAVQRKAEAARLAQAEVTWEDRRRGLLGESAKQEQEIAKIRNQGLAARKSEAEIEKMVADYKAKNPLKADGEAARAAKKDLEEQRRAVNEALGVTNDYVETLTRYQRARDAGTISEQAYTKAIGELIAKQPSSRELTKQQAEAEKKLEQAQRDRLEVAKRIEAIESKALADGQQRNATLAADVQQQRRQAEELGKTGVALAALRAGYVDLDIAVAESTLVAAKSNDIGDERISQMEREIQLLKEKRDAILGNASAAARFDADQEVAKSLLAGQTQSAQAFDQMGQALANSIMQGGKNGLEYIQDMARSMVLTPMMRMGMQSVAQSFGSMAGPGLTSLFGAGQGLGGMATSFATSSIGAALGLSESVAGGAGSMLTGAGSALQGVATAAPYLAIGLALYSAFAKKRGGPKSGGSYSSTGERLFTPNGSDGDLAGVGGGILGSASKLAGLYGGSASGLQIGLGFDTDPQGTASNRIASFVRTAGGASVLNNTAGRDVGRDEATLKAELEVESKRVLLAALQASDLESGFAELFKRLDPAEAAPEAIDNILALASNIRTLGESAKDMPGVMGSVADLSVAARESLLSLAGGIDALAQKQATYYSEFFSAQEQVDNSGRVLTGRFAAIGLSFEALAANADGPRQAFRQLVEGLDLTSESGRQSYAALLNLAGPLDQYLDGLDGLKTSTEKVTTVTLASGEAVQDFSTEIERLKASVTSTETEMSAIANALATISPPAETAADRLVRMSGELKSLESALDDVMGNGGQSNIQKLQGLIGARDSLTAARGGIADAIDAQRLQGFQTRGDTAGAVAFLKAMEGRLWASLGTAADKGAVANRIKDVFLQRIGLEAGSAQNDVNAAAKDALAGAQKVADLERAARTAQIKGLQEIISNAEQFKGIAEGLRRTVGDLRFSDLSPLSPGDQLGAAQSEFGRVLARAQGGDLTALQQIGGVGTAYIQEARSFGASSGGTADVFNTVTAALEALGVSLDGTSVSDAQRQLEVLQSIEDPILTLASTTVDYSGKAIEGLNAIDAALGAGVDYLQSAAVTATNAVADQVAGLRADRDREAAALQAYRVALGADLDRVNTRLQAIENAIEGNTTAVVNAADTVPVAG